MHVAYVDPQEQGPPKMFLAVVYCFVIINTCISVTHVACVHSFSLQLKQWLSKRSMSKTPYRDPLTADFSHVVVSNLMGPWSHSLTSSFWWFWKDIILCSLHWGLKAGKASLLKWMNENQPVREWFINCAWLYDAIKEGINLVMSQNITSHFRLRSAKTSCSPRQ